MRWRFLAAALLLALAWTGTGCALSRSGGGVGEADDSVVPPTSEARPPSPESLLPTRTRAVAAEDVVVIDAAGATATSEPFASPAPVPTVAGQAATPESPSLPPDLPSGRERFGVGVPVGSIADYPVEHLGIGWYVNWRVEVSPARPGGVAFWQMIRVSEGGYSPDADTIRVAALANPGSVWLIGNEPDVEWQDGVTPDRYAEVYHELYALLKSVDPTCRVGGGGIAQPTPLRLAYLDRVLAAYQSRYGQPMPVDIWSVHGFLLREERDSWGVGIPPGFDEVTHGALLEIDDHDDLLAFREQIVTFRRWMADRGQRDRPLVLSEYGILMPWDYGFGQERVEAFMLATFNLLQTAADDATGYPADGNRLVQWWCWYSLADTVYPTGNLFDPVTRLPTALGAAFARH